MSDKVGRITFSPYPSKNNPVNDNNEQAKIRISAQLLAIRNSEELADRYADLRIENEQLKQQLAAKQAKIDELMMEYCPEEMTEEQMKEYEAAQRRVDIEL